MSFELYKRFMDRYGGYLERAPGVKKALNSIIKTLEENKKKDEIFEKALGNYIDRLHVLPILLNEGDSNEAKDLILRRVVKSGEILANFQKLRVLDATSKEQLKKNSEYLNLEEIARNNIKINLDYIKEEQLGLYFRYNKSPDEKPIEIFTNKDAINSIWDVLLNNSMVWAHPLSTITQAFRIDKKNNLEIIIQNTYSKERPREPNGVEGEGIPIIKSLVEKINGNLELYKTKSQIKNNYNQAEEFGSKIAIKNRKDDAEKYGAKIIIPMNELKSYEKEI